MFDLVDYCTLEADTCIFELEEGGSAETGQEVRQHADTRRKVQSSEEYQRKLRSEKGWASHHRHIIILTNANQLY